MSVPRLEARAVHFSYMSAAPVIRGASLFLNHGGMGALIGPNGCGKSTLIRLMAGLLAPSQGEVRLNGEPLSSLTSGARTQLLAYVPQSTARAFPFTALEVVLTGRMPHLPRFAFESRRDVEKAREALEATGIAYLAERRITELSGGERQLVSVARALAQEPSCLLLDEPAASLDLKHPAALVRTLANLRESRGLTILMVTHDLSLIQPEFSIVFAMHRGVIAASGSPSETLQESVLAEIYEDQNVRVRHTDGRTFVWSEAS